MSAVVFLRYMQGISPFVYRLNLERPFETRSYMTVQKAELAAQRNFKEMKNKLNFEQFQQTKVESFEAFKKSPEIKQLFGDDGVKISDAYKAYCECKYNRYLKSVYGGNPATMC